LGATDVACTYFGGQPMTMMSEEEGIPEHLVKAAQERAKVQGYSLDESGMLRLRDLAVEALPRISPDEVPRAPIAFRRLVDEMIVVSKAAGGDKILGKESVDLALLKICPIWPIC
jgi:hypothetical protein